MRVGLFIPCYIDQFYPNVAIATLQLLERLGCIVGVPSKQTCCGQPMANSGFVNLTEGCTALFQENFSGFDYVVSPSGSCVLHIKHMLAETQPGVALHAKIFELAEFMTDVLDVRSLSSEFKYRVGFHQSCHGQRGLHLSSMSEVMGDRFSKPAKLLQMVKGISMIPLTRPDECCGFGGTFSVFENAVSVKMGKDRIADHSSHGVDYITSNDMSCLMHLEGILRRQKSSIRVIHIAEILNAEG